MKKGKHFRRRKKKKKGKERKEEEKRRKEKKKKKERKGVETFRKEKWKGNILQRRRKERKIRKEEKACGGSCSDVVGYGELSFRYSRGPAYQGIIGGIACGVRVNG